MGLIVKIFIELQISDIGRESWDKTSLPIQISDQWGMHMTEQWNEFFRFDHRTEDSLTARSMSQTPPEMNYVITCSVSTGRFQTGIPPLNNIPFVRPACRPSIHAQENRPPAVRRSRTFSTRRSQSPAKCL